MRISDWSSDVCSSDLELEARFSVNAPALKRQTRAAPDRDGLSFPCGGDNFGGRKFDRAGDTELAEQRVYVAARNYAAQQRASVGCHEASNLRIITKQVPDRKKAADGEEEALAMGILAEPVALGRPAVRSEERRVGKVWVSTGRARGAAFQ